MQNWKKVVVFGSIGAGALLILMGRRPIGMALAAGGLAVLASEYPEKFEGLIEDAPDYLHKGMEIFAGLKKVGEGFAEEADTTVKLKAIKSPCPPCLRGESLRTDTGISKSLWKGKGAQLAHPSHFLVRLIVPTYPTGSVCSLPAN